MPELLDALRRACARGGRGIWRYIDLPLHLYFCSLYVPQHADAAASSWLYWAPVRSLHDVPGIRRGCWRTSSGVSQACFDAMESRCYDERHSF